MKRSILLTVLALSCITAPLFAQSAEEEGAVDYRQRGRHRGPPQEAIEACSGKPEGAECSFVGRRGETLEGTCFAGRYEGDLACRPSHGPEGRDMPPPREEPPAEEK